MLHLARQVTKDVFTTGLLKPICEHVKVMVPHDILMPVHVRVAAAASLRRPSLHLFLASLEDFRVFLCSLWWFRGLNPRRQRAQPLSATEKTVLDEIKMKNHRFSNRCLGLFASLLLGMLFRSPLLLSFFLPSRLFSRLLFTKLSSTSHQSLVWSWWTPVLGQFSRCFSTLIGFFNIVLTQQTKAPGGPVWSSGMQLMRDMWSGRSAVGELA